MVCLSIQILPWDENQHLVVLYLILEFIFPRIKGPKKIPIRFLASDVWGGTIGEKA